MFVERLKLVNFRNYNELDISFNPNINILFGFNAQGKTNVFEALYFVACGRSHRTNRDRELINWDKKECYIGTEIKKAKEELKIDIKLNAELKKDIRINYAPIKKIGELMGNLNAVMFSPEDLKLVKEGPSERRRFIDIEISQIRPNYFYNLQQYMKILHHRNALLKNINSNKALIETLPVWDNNLVEIGSKLMYYRNVYLKKLMNHALIIHKRIAKEDIRIIYSPSFAVSNFEDLETIKSTFADYVKRNRQRDIQAGSTSIGPHRDDFDIFINDIDVKSFGSQGQQRTVALSLKLSEIELFKEELGEYPILLLDDVMSELDEKRQEYLIENLQDLQVFITCTDREKYYYNRASIYEVSAGIINML